MEYCVLIPKELSLSNNVKYMDHAADNFSIENTSPLVVVANTKILKGTKFRALEGTMRYGQVDLRGYNSTSSPRSISWMHRYFDSTIDNRRHCNWIKFLTITQEYNAQVNFICTNLQGEPIYEATRTIFPSSQLIAFYEEENDVEESELILYQRQQQEIMDQILELTPIDFSRKLLISDYSNLSNEVKPLANSIGINNLNIPRHRGRQSNGIHSSRNMLPCEVCGKAFDRPSLLRRHMRTHTGEKPHVCDVCGKGFSTSSSLNTHRRIHSGEKPHQCPICGKRFTASSNLYYHRMTHTKNKPHKCSMCGKSFPTPGDLKAHAYIHNGHWPYKCSICNRGFSKQTNLKNHLFLHTGDKPHVCKICDKRFALACNLRAHLKTHQQSSSHFKSTSSTSSSSSPSSAKAGPVNLLSEEKSLNNENNLQQFFLMTASLLALKYRDQL